MSIKIPYDCPRGRNDCIALSNILSDGGQSFFCCGENDGQHRAVDQDKYTVCFKGPRRDEVSHNDKRDLIHNASVLIAAVAVIEPESGGGDDWSPWRDL